jgi:lipopolysaccharide transport system permease protein
VPERWRWVAALNPMSVPTEAMKRMLLGVGGVTAPFVAISAGVTLVLLLSGLALFSRVEKTFVDTI